jgi:hypothetical protein
MMAKIEAKNFKCHLLYDRRLDVEELVQIIIRSAGQQRTRRTSILNAIFLMVRELYFKKYKKTKLFSPVLRLITMRSKSVKKI